MALSLHCEECEETDTKRGYLLIRQAIEESPAVSFFNHRERGEGGCARFIVRK